MVFADTAGKILGKSIEIERLWYASIKSSTVVNVVWLRSWLNRQLEWLFWPRQQSALQMHESDPELTVPYWLLLLRS